MDSDIEAWSPMTITPSPIPKKHLRLIGDSKENASENFHALGSSVLCFESPAPRERLARPGRRRYRSKFAVVSRILWISTLLITFIWFWLFARGGKKLVEVQTASFSNIIETQQLQFFSANDEHIRYVGRWTAVESGIGVDGSFPGVYLEFAVFGTRTITLSLQNGLLESYSPGGLARGKPPGAAKSSLESNNTSYAAPISLLALVDDDDYVVLPNATSIVHIRDQDLEPNTVHNIRIVAPMMDTISSRILQMRGIWLDNGGTLVYSDLHANKGKATKKTLEIVTDTLWVKTCQRQNGISPSQAVLSGVISWQYLLGEMFAVDHVRVGVDGMCLIQECVGGKASPSGIADIFFQSGPPGTEQSSKPWRFEAYEPDVMVMNLGSSDWQSFQIYSDEYNKTKWNMTVEFEDTYVTLIKAIRALAYPSQITTVDTGISGDVQPQRRMPLPIFVMRPFRGQLEQATQSVVNRLRLEGDKYVFWLDTSGWLNTDIDFRGQVEEQDFFLDEDDPSKEWRLTERGNRRVAMLFHMHVCRYLAADPERCVFLPPTIYESRSGPNNNLRSLDLNWQ